MAMTSAKFKVVKFDGTGNFGLWQTRVKDLLAQQGILKVLRSQKPASIDDEDWEELQQHAAGTIRLCLADEIMYHVMNLKSPCEEGFDLAQHVNVFNQIITDLTRLDVNIEDEDKAMILLCSLPFSYKHLVTTLTYGKETIKVDEITAALLAHYQQKQNARESSYGDSLYVKGSGSRHTGQVILVLSIWVMILGGDDVRIKMYDGTVRTLSDVRHIPNLKKNPISLGILHKNGFIPKADEDREAIRIVKGALTIMKGKITAGNIYKLLGNTVVGGVHSVDSCDDNTKLWHMRLGHLSECGMPELHKRNLLHGVKSFKLDFYSQFSKFCEEHEIQRHFSVRKTPQQNGVAERMNRSLTERARCLRLNVGLPKNFWAGAVSMACYLINRSPRASLGTKVAEEMELEPHPVATENRGRSHPTSSDPVPAESGGSSTTHELQTYNLARDRQRRTNVKPPSRLGYEDMVSFALLVSGDEPTTFHGAITSQEKKEWMGAMVEEMESLHKNQT
ncbi:UNVERIFIED_CONTAM: Retrovirus-related Pol polyprotein from transposon TNT 1-94 [Sesamum calycinum]|uniref:Retrovirus-related Pol polyprotein from transposon TNT 1-94 n=1 Tax=Sesamum calycinum TaxID=2727403 RepID=A0AAW2MPZ6_9LAMI